MSRTNMFGRRQFVTSALATLALARHRAWGAALAAPAGEPARFRQDRFAVSFWVDPPADAHMDEYYAQIAAANFTVVMGDFGATTPQAVSRQLDLCGKYSLKAVVNLPGYSGLPAADIQSENAAGRFANLPGYGGPRTPGIVATENRIKQADQFPDHPACWGYRIWDEPSTALFPYLRFMVEHLRKRRPGKLGFINLLPTYANDQQLGEHGNQPYEKYVAGFVREVNPDVLCMDHYPFMQPGRDTRDAYAANLAVLRKYALSRKIPFWNFFNDMAFDSHFDPTEEQIRWQIHTSLAYGAKGVLYFCYWTPPEFKAPALLTQTGRLTHHYAQAQRINARLKNWGPTLMQLTSTAIYRVPRGADPAPILRGAPLQLQPGLTPGNYLIGVFNHADGRTAVLLTNYSYAYTAWPAVSFAADAQNVSEVDPASGKEIPIRHDAANPGGHYIWLGAGDARLFLFHPTRI